MDELPIGRRVAYWRGRRRMSQQVFADRLGKSKSWVDKVERGVRRLDKISVIHEIAEVLQIDPQLLLGHEPARRPGHNSADMRAHPPEIAQIRAALECYDQVNVFLQAPPEPPDLDEIRKAVSHAWLTYQHAKGGVLLRTLPRLLRDAQAAEAAYKGDTNDGRKGATLLAEVYQITSSTLRNLGEHELAWLAADRALTLAQRAKDELLAGVATFRVGMALLAMHRSRPAMEVNVSIANRLAPTNKRKAAPERLSVYGMLLLQGAMAAARLGDAATVRDLLNEAEEAAMQLGEDANHYWSCFGPTNVMLHRVAAAVELGDSRYAVEEHERIDQTGFRGLVPERRVHHLIDVARGCTQLGDLDGAASLLREADQLASDELRSRPVAWAIVGELTRRNNGEPPAAVCDLAEHVGIAR